MASLKLQPGWPDRAATQAWRHATAPAKAGSLPEKSLPLAKQACQATEPAMPPRFLDALAAAYANAGQFDQATARRALDGTADEDYARELLQRLACYEHGQPFRRPTTAPAAQVPAERPPRNAAPPKS